MSLLELSDVSFRYDGAEVLRKLDFLLKENEFVSVIGSSGVGKSTFLKLVGGEVNACSGSIELTADIANVDQGYQLFPHLTTLGNVELVLRRREDFSDRLKSNAEVRSKALSYLKQVGLEGLEEKSIHQLSGGQRQRVSFAMALGQDAKIFLLDEPFGALDAQNRDLMQALAVSLVKLNDISVIMVTHDLEEAVYCSDRILVLRGPGEVVELPIDSKQHGDVRVKGTDHFIKQVAMLRDITKPSMVEHPSWQSKLRDRAMISESEMMNLEQRADRVLVITKNFFQEEFNPIIAKTVDRNLTSGIPYQYFVPCIDESMKKYQAKSKGLATFNVWSGDKADVFFALGECVLYRLSNGENAGYSYMGETSGTTLYRLPDALVKQALHIAETKFQK